MLKGNYKESIYQYHVWLIDLYNLYFPLMGLINFMAQYMVHCKLQVESSPIKLIIVVACDEPIFTSFIFIGFAYHIYILDNNAQ